MFLVLQDTAKLRETLSGLAAVGCGGGSAANRLCFKMLFHIRIALQKKIFVFGFCMSIYVNLKGGKSLF